MVTIHVQKANKVQILYIAHSVAQLHNPVKCIVKILAELMSNKGTQAKTSTSIHNLLEYNFFSLLLEYNVHDISDPSIFSNCCTIKNICMHCKSYMSWHFLANALSWGHSNSRPYNYKMIRSYGSGRLLVPRIGWPLPFIEPESLQKRSSQIWHEMKLVFCFGMLASLWHITALKYPFAVQ